MSEKDCCIKCGREKDFLLAIITNIDKNDFFIRNRGICLECLMTPNLNLDKLSDEFQKRKINEEIKKAKDGLDFWTNELNNYDKKQND